MKYITDYLEIVYNSLTKKDFDSCIAIVGDEGSGKSNLGLHLAEWWYNKLNGECKAEDIKHICLDRQQFAKDLRDDQKYELTIYDEAGDINSRRSMASFNVAVMQAYQVIRGDNLFTIFILPSLWDLDSFFRKRRLRGMFHVYKRGRCAFWGREELRAMIALNANLPVKNYFITKPLFHDTFSIYKGVLADPYLKKKTEKMKTVRETLYKSIMEDKGDSPLAKRNEIIAKVVAALGTAKAAEVTGLAQRTVRQIKQQAQA